MTTPPVFPLRLETNRLRLFTAESKHVEAILTYLTENKIFFQPWMSTVTPTYYTQAEQQRWIEHDYQLYRTKAKLKFYIATQQAPNEIIGDIVFSNIIFGGFQSCFLGYKQAEKHNGNGYMKEGIETAVNYMFNAWKLHRIEANIVPRNLKSIRLIKGLGFEEEGLSTKYLQLNGVWEDHIHFVKRNTALE
jgi:ribosomal-protein-alanine N-acetyltransferase